MNEKKTTGFRDEIRRSLIHHALVPCILSLTALVLIFMLIGFQQIKQKNLKASGEYAVKFETMMNDYIEKNREVCESINIPDFLADTSYRVDTVSDLYRFLSGRQIKADYYLFNCKKQNIFSTQSERSIVRYMEQYLLWGMSEWTGDKRKEVIFTYGKDNVGVRSEPIWAIFGPVMREGKILGYSGFVLPADRFYDRFSGQEQAVLVTNRFNRVFSQGFYHFQDERGKLFEEFRQGRGLLKFDDRYYYISDKWILEGTTRILAVYDCTSFVQLCMMALLSVVLIGLVMTWAIYRSAGTVAAQKTEILYELIFALDQVEKGDLNVSLDITTGDEFEQMGSSFNMMLGSLRHLIERHSELARENMLATAQTLEAQFNPHFLFNTLESVRYMIKFEPLDAEKMIVSLSKLLRYSIQNGGDKVALKEELKFIDRYLQIMLYRHGERLNYRIETSGCDDSILIPPMILQPVVENSIKYGFDDDRDLLNIIISGRIEDKMLVLAVRDDGAGIEEGLLTVLSSILEQKQNQTEHIGLYNVDRRIKLTYGTKKGVSIQSHTGEGTEVTIEIPI